VCDTSAYAHTSSDTNLNTPTSAEGGAGKKLSLRRKAELNFSLHAEQHRRLSTDLKIEISRAFVTDRLFEMLPPSFLLLRLVKSLPRNGFSS
jgi:hypothetical protein